jgi:lipoprotein-releasing system ATP-binding protein
MSLIVQNLDKEYPTRSGALSVLRGVNLTLEQGQSLAITGPSGSGKSTLLHILGTLDQPTRGEYTLNDAKPFSLNDAELAQFRNQRLGFVFQEHHLLPQCNVLENVLIPTLVNPATNPKEVEDFARDLLKRVGLSDRLEHRPAELSGGERQRVAIARALIRKPKLLLADEPTGNLDRKNAQAIGELLFELHREQYTILVVVTHSQELAKLFPMRSEMSDGQLLKL